MGFFVLNLSSLIIQNQLNPTWYGNWMYSLNCEYLKLCGIAEVTVCGCGDDTHMWGNTDCCCLKGFSQLSSITNKLWMMCTVGTKDEQCNKMWVYLLHLMLWDLLLVAGWSAIHRNMWCYRCIPSQRCRYVNGDVQWDLRRKVKNWNFEDLEKWVGRKEQRKEGRWWWWWGAKRREDIQGQCLLTGRMRG